MDGVTEGHGDGASPEGQRPRMAEWGCKPGLCQQGPCSALHCPALCPGDSKAFLSCAQSPSNVPSAVPPCQPVSSTPLSSTHELMACLPCGREAEASACTPRTERGRQCTSTAPMWGHGVCQQVSCDSGCQAELHPSSGICGHGGPHEGHMTGRHPGEYTRHC